MSDDPDSDNAPPPPQRPIGMEPRREPSGAIWAGLPVWVWTSLGVLLLAGAAYVGIMIALGIGPADTPEATPIAGDARPADLFVAGFYDALSFHDYVYASTLVGQPLAERYDPAALRARWEAFEANRGRVVVLAPESAGENTVVQRLRTGDGASFEMRVTVERADGAWRIVAAEPDLVPAR
jgi:hypothetical protein